MATRTIDVVRGALNDLLVVHTVGPGPVPHSPQPADNVLCHPAVLCQLAAKLLDHAIDVVELSLVARGCRHRHSCRHIRAIHTVHHGDMLLLLLLLLLVMSKNLMLLGLRGVLIGRSLLELLLIRLLVLLLLLVMTRRGCRRRRRRSGRWRRR